MANATFNGYVCVWMCILLCVWLIRVCIIYAYIKTRASRLRACMAMVNLHLNIINFAPFFAHSPVSSHSLALLIVYILFYFLMPLLMLIFSHCSSAFLQFHSLYCIQNHHILYSICVYEYVLYADCHLSSCSIR